MSQLSRQLLALKQIHKYSRAFWNAYVQYVVCHHITITYSEKQPATIKCIILSKRLCETYGTANHCGIHATSRRENDTVKYEKGSLPP